jgi:Protein of unknown function (DUF2846)
MKAKAVLGFTCGMLIAAAPPPSAPAIAPVTEVAGENGLLFVYRDYAEPIIWAPAVKVDGRKIVGIGNGKYTAVSVTPGLHIVTLKWPIFASQSGSQIGVRVEKGKTYFLEVTGVSRYIAPYVIESESGFILVEPKVGVASIQQCCTFQPPK